ncbi:lysyl oxidase homolog 2-like [Amphiura filiformis]|uniref:lysyl oxidase homolog 2-like n=1 Tax=Amphiura filiformis TaxID=82378 RepID=UPI003B21F2A4
MMTSVNGETEGDVRLVDPGDECTSKKGCGRVEIFHDNQWGTVCNDYWDLDDAAVVCRQLGYPAALKAFKHKDISGSKKGPIWMDNVRCDGIESRLVDCVFYPWGSHNCFANHTEDSAVECQVGAVQGDVRLIEHESKPHENEGILQLFNDDKRKWIYVCNPSWGITESLVICRQLGYTAATDFYNPNPSDEPEVVCNGNEATLSECSIEFEVLANNCDIKNAVNVTCSKTIPDSLADALYNPANYKYTSFITPIHPSGNKQATLQVIRKGIYK